VGNNPQTYDIGAAWVTGNSQTLVLPGDGRTLYVTLWLLINGAWRSNAYTYKAFGP
jgi:hypothetical protein